MRMLTDEEMSILRKGLVTRVFDADNKDYKKSKALYDEIKNSKVFLED